MGNSSGGHLPVFLVLAFFAIAASGCIGQPPEPGQADDFGARVEALNARISAAGSESSVKSIGADLHDLRAVAENESRYSGFLVLMDAQNLTLESLLVKFEFQREVASFGAAPLDCGKNYSGFVSRLRGANATAESAASKARSYLSSNPNSTAKTLLYSIQALDTPTMAAYADLIEDEIASDCPAPMEPDGAYALPISAEDGLNIASKIAGSGYFVYGLGSPLEEGTVITAIRASEDFNFTLGSQAWFYFLDSDPESAFGHDVKFVMVYAANGSYVVMGESMYPEIDGVPYWESIDERSDPSNILYPDNAGDFLGMPANLSESSYRRIWFMPLAGEGAPALSDELCCLEKRKFALILTGSNDTMFQKDTAAMYGHLKASGYGDGDISYLTSSNETPGSDGVTTVANLALALGKLAQAKCCDEVFIYFAGHGSKQPVRQFKHKTTGQTAWVSRVSQLGASPGDWEATGASGFYHKLDVNRGKAGGGHATADNIADFLKDIKSCHVSILYQSCFSGGAVPTLSGSGRTIMTPVDGEHSSYGNAATGSTFTQSYLAAKGAANASADKNHDGTVSEKEAFDYADRKNHDRIEAVRDHWQDKADAETDPANKSRFQAKADGMQEQIGKYDYKECTCCYLDCNQSTHYFCQAFVAMNRNSSPLCRMAGDTCANDTAGTGMEGPPGTAGNDTGGNETGKPPPGNASNETGTGAGGEPPVNVSAICGDGIISSPEQCDHGSAGTNKCGEGNYCRDCQCRKLETSVVCGDGKISAPSEDCDGGSVDYKICPTGYTCRICKCVPTESACGDGTVTPPEECDHGNSYTDDCPGGKVCSGCKCYAPGDEPPSEAYCGNNKREGAEECDGTDAPSCTSEETCTSCACVAKSAVCGDGKKESPEQCERDSDCGSGEHCSSCRCVSTPTYCGDGKINGNEACDGSGSGCDEGGVCSTGCTCVYPPSLDCGYICSQTPGAQSFGGGYASQDACADAVKSAYGTTTCYLTCSYAWYYKATNIAGSSSCCCGMKKMFACSDCPGENPECPSTSTCDANAPSWYSPS